MSIKREMKTRTTILLSIILLSVILGSLKSPAVPPDPGVYGIINKPGDNFTYQALPETLESVSQRSNDLVKGIQNIIVILVEFKNLAHNPAHDIPYFENLIFSSSNPHSMYNYYKEISYGQIIISGTVTGWYRSDQNLEYYGADGSKTDNLNAPVYELTREAVNLADSNGFDFSKYDNNLDGYIDHIIVVHSGRGQETGGGFYGPDAIWSHHWSIWPSEKVDGIYASDYSMVAEFSPMGTLAHEFGHDLGLPDLYDTDGSSQGIGAWGLMGYGSWQMGGDVPAHLCAWSKIFLGWAEPKEINISEINIILNCIENSNKNTILKIPLNTQEYFLLENRRKVGFDEYLPGEGLLIWHIDDSVGKLEFNDVNNLENHKRVDLEEADGRDDLDKKINNGDNMDPYYNGKSFTLYTIPDSKPYSASSLIVSIINVGATGDMMNLDIDIDQDTINIKPVQDMTINLTSGWNLISLYLQPLDTSCESVLLSLGDKCLSVWAYNNGASSWQKFVVNGPKALNDLNKIVFGSGYWIVMNQPGILTLKGTQPEEAISLKAGWNLVGCNSNEFMTIKSYMSPIEDKIDTIGTYNSQDGKWLWYKAGQPEFLNNLKSIEPGKGYLINVKENCIWNWSNNQ
jgi:M6 family metalloprotease-like protein